MIKIDGIITSDEYLDTCIAINGNGVPAYAVRLKDSKVYELFTTSEKVGKSKKKVYVIKKDDKYYRLDDTIKKYISSTMSIYSREGI